MLKANAVRKQMQAATRILMCEPSHFQVIYSINPWMDVKKRVDRTMAWKQWNALKATIEDAGAQVEVMRADGAERLPDLVFTANSAVVRGNRALISNFRCNERKNEHEFYTRWFEQHGYRTMFNPDIPFEGAGDALWAGHTMFCGVGPRTDPGALQLLTEFLGKGTGEEDPLKVLGCKLVDQRFYHIDTCFCPLNDRLALFYPNAFDVISRHNMSNEIELVPVSEDDAMRFVHKGAGLCMEQCGIGETVWACNAVVVDTTVITNEGCEKTARILEKLGYQTKFVDMSEFMKSGGSAKCCTLQLPSQQA